jgi:hypothetical protein
MKIEEDRMHHRGGRTNGVVKATGEAQRRGKRMCIFL